MNDIFVSNESAGGDDYENTTYFSNKTRYIQSKDIEVLSFSNDSDFPIISLNIRSIVNTNNFAKFERFLDTLLIKPYVIGLNETWITDSS